MLVKCVLKIKSSLMKQELETFLFALDIIRDGFYLYSTIRLDQHLKGIPKKCGYRRIAHIDELLKSFRKR